MSIQSEITRISGNVSDALDAIEDKGVTIPTGSNSDDLATLIGQIDTIQYASGDMATFNYSTAGMPITSVVADIEPIQAGSGDPSASNVRAISGHSTVTVRTAGKNLIYFPALNHSSTASLTFTVNSNHELVIYGTASANCGDAYSGNWLSTYADMPFEFPAGTYKITCSGFVGQVSTDRIIINARYADGTSPSGVNSGGSRISSSTGTSATGQVLTITATKTFRIGAPYVYVTKNTSIDCTVKLWMEKADEFGDYEPYQGSTQSISLGRTVYGATLNVTTGKLMVTHGYATFDGTESWGGPDASGNFYLNLSDAGKMTDRKTGGLYGELLFNVLKHGGTAAGAGYVSTGGYLDAKPTGISTLSEWTTLLGTTNLQCVYPLATPATYQLTPTEVTTLMGENNVWATSGEVEVTIGGGSPAVIEELDVSASGTYMASGGVDGYSPVVVPAGTAGTPTATKGTVSNHAITVTPSVTNTSGFITGSTINGTGVSVSASELASGNKEITSNGSNIDVVGYSTVSVNVSGGSSKNVQYVMGSESVRTNGYTSTGMSITVAKAGTYKVSWVGWRSSSQGTMGTNLYKNGNAGTAQQTFTNTYGQCITLENQSYNKDDVLTLYATAGSTSRYMWVANLIIEEQ